MTTITTLPDAPSRTDPATFSTKSDALLGALATFVSETNTVAGECVTNAATATTKAGEAVISAAAAAASAVTANTKAGEASVSASSASGSAGTANTKAGEASASAIAAAASAVTANTKAGEAAASAASIAGGPVASVNGRTGVVTGVQDSLVSGTSIKTINSTSLLGSGDIAITGNATHTGDATGDTALTVVKINGTLMSGLATGILKNTTGTGVPSIAVAGTDYCAAVGSTGVTTLGTITTGTWNATDIAVADGGTGRSTGTTAYALVATGTTATGAQQTLAAGATTEVLVGGGASALPVWTTATGSGSPVRATSPTITTPTIDGGTFTNGYTEETVTANTSTSYTIDLANGTVQILTLTGNCTYTFPANTAGKSFLLVQKQDATGSRTVTWDSDVKWPASTAPTITGTASKADVFAFTCDGTYWYGRVIGQNYL